MGKSITRNLLEHLDILVNNAILQVPCYVRKKATVGDVVVVATDGVWDYVSENEVVRCVMENKSVQTACRALLDKSISMCTELQKIKGNDRPGLRWLRRWPPHAVSTSASAEASLTSGPVKHALVPTLDI